MSSSEVDLIVTVGESQCIFCSADIVEGEGIVLNKCLHTFCRECIRTLIEQSTASQIKCPVSEELFCDGYLLDPEIKALVSPQSYEKYLARSLSQAGKEDDLLYTCKKENCSGIHYLEKDTTSFMSVLCQTLNCGKCEPTPSLRVKLGRLRYWLRGADVSTSPHGEKRKADDDLKENTMKQQRLEEPQADADKELATDWESRWEQMEKLVQTNSSQNEDKGLGDSQILFVDFLQTTDTLISTEPFECSICMMDIPANTGIILQECFHTFCPTCVQSTIEHCQDPVVKCPFKGTHTSCDAVINEREVKSLVSKEIYERYLSRSISTAEMYSETAFHCKSVDCPGWCECEEDVHEFNCPICKKTNCIKCKAIHEGLSCEKYRMREILTEAHKNEEVASAKKQEELIRSGEAMRCPKCKIVIIKNGGCNRIQCLSCNETLCWATKGLRYGPKGCQCGVDGKLCHPKCWHC